MLTPESVVLCGRCQQPATVNGWNERLREEYPDSVHSIVPLERGYGVWNFNYVCPHCECECSGEGLRIQTERKVTPRLLMNPQSMFSQPEGRLLHGTTEFLCWAVNHCDCQWLTEMDPAAVTTGFDSTGLYTSIPELRKIHQVDLHKAAEFAGRLRKLLVAPTKWAGALWVSSYYQQWFWLDTSFPADSYGLYRASPDQHLLTVDTTAPEPFAGIQARLAHTIEKLTELYLTNC